MGPILLREKIMNAIKQVTRDIATSVGHTTTAASSLVLVTTGTVKDTTGAVATGIKALPGVLAALWSLPKNSMVGYVQEAEQCTLEEAQAKVNSMLPESVADAIVMGSISTGALMAALFEDDNDDTATTEQPKLEADTKVAGK